MQKVNEQGDVKEIFTFQSIKDAIIDVYPESAEDIITDFVNMLFFDAIVGNNDRHFENWGVIENIKDKSEARFSPVYDTARGLFWNHPESNLDAYIEHESKLDSYIKGSVPTTGWDNEKNLNHFKLLDRLMHSYPQYCDFILTFDFKVALDDIKEVINGEFTEFFSSQRRYIVEKCIAKRIERIQKLI